MNAYDHGTFIKNNAKYNPNVWLYNGIKHKDIKSLGDENSVNKSIYNENVENFWNTILKEEFENCIITEDGQVEDDISKIIHERNTKECKCGNIEKSNKRKCSKCKEHLEKNDGKKIKVMADGGTVSGVQRRTNIYKDIERGKDFKPADLVMGEPLNRNPSTYEDTKHIIREESISSCIVKYGAGLRNWLAILCDGSPFKNFLALLQILTFCRICKSPAGNTSKHLKEYHDGKKDADKIELEFDHILPLNGAGHTEKLLMESVTKLMWHMIGLGKFATWCDFGSDKAQMFLMNFSDHHKGADFILIILRTIAKEIAFEFLKVWKVRKNKVPKYKDLVTFLNNNSEVRNINLIRFFQLVNGPLLSVFFLRCGVRCANGPLYYAAYERCSLWTFLNKNSNYQIISSFELYLIEVAPKEVKDFIYRMIFHRNKKTASWDSSSEGLDYRMEERNKVIKQTLQNDNPTMDDWKRAASNVENMETILDNSRKDYKYNVEASDAYAPKYDEKIEYLDDVSLHKDNLIFEEKARDMKKEYLENIVTSQSFVNAALPKFTFQMFPN